MWVVDMAEKVSKARLRTTYTKRQRKASWTHYGMKTSEDVGGRHGREGEQSKVRNHMMIYKETKESQLETLWNEEIRRCGW
jgi:hypothetical protein